MTENGFLSKCGEQGGMQESVALALSFDMHQAVALANRPQEDEALQRKLWLAIACHLIQTAAARPDGTPVRPFQLPAGLMHHLASNARAVIYLNLDALLLSPHVQGESIKKINEFMRDAGGLIKIEDILPLFPDFVQIDNFKEAICQSLEDYNSQIANLKSEMDDATHIADALRCMDWAIPWHHTSVVQLLQAIPAEPAVQRFHLYLYAVLSCQLSTCIPSRLHKKSPVSRGVML